MQMAYITSTQYWSTKHECDVTKVTKESTNFKIVAYYLAFGCTILFHNF